MPQYNLPVLDNWKMLYEAPLSCDKPFNPLSARNPAVARNLISAIHGVLEPIKGVFRPGTD